MAHTPRITAAVANAGMTAMFGGTICDLGIIEIWSDAGAQPAAGGGSSGTSVLLAELTMNASAWTGAPSSGVLTAAAITQDSSANATGTDAQAAAYDRLTAAIASLTEPPPDYAAKTEELKTHTDLLNKGVTS